MEPKPHILLIDDKLEELCALVTLIKEQPWRLTLISDARRGYLLAAALRPDLILLDVLMPGMDGFAMCRLLRESPDTCDIPIIFLSSAVSVEDRLAGLSLGGVDFVTKPFDPREVLARIRIHLQLAAQRCGAAPAADNETEAPRDASQALLNAAMRYIEEHLADLPTLATIAASVGTHEKRLSRLFREQLGVTVFGFAAATRMRRGRELLAGSDLGMQDIAELVGFQSAANFATAFRRSEGMTPSEYRERMRKGPSG